MAYCPFCGGNYSINIKTQSYTDYEDSTEDTYRIDEYGSYSEFDKISTTHKSTPVSRSYSYEVCSNCSRKLEYPHATTEAEFINCEKNAFEQLRTEGLKNINRNISSPKDDRLSSNQFLSIWIAILIPLFILNLGNFKAPTQGGGYNLFLPFVALIFIIWLLVIPIIFLIIYYKRNFEYKKSLSKFKKLKEKHRPLIMEYESLKYSHKNYLYLLKKQGKKISGSLDY